MVMHAIEVPLKSAGDKPRTIYVTWRRNDGETGEANLTMLLLHAR